MTNERDQLWLWGHQAGSLNKGWNLPGPSIITPVEAAHYMGIPNLIMVRYGADDLPATPRNVIPCRSLKQVVWSVVGAGGRTDPDETERVVALPEVLPNMTGLIMEECRKLSGNCRIVLGCYMWDFGGKAPMPSASMQHQCELGLRWLRSGRIDGMIFLASCICDLELEAVEWTRAWIQNFGQ